MTKPLTESDIIGDKRTHSLLLGSAVLDKITVDVTEESAWAIASITALAVSATIQYSATSSAAAITYSWLYFLIIAIVGIGMSTIKGKYDNPKNVAQELQSNVVQRKKARGEYKPKVAEEDEEERLLTSTINENGGTTNVSKKDNINSSNGLIEKQRISSKEKNAIKVLKFIELEFNVLLVNVIALIIATIANITAMALNDASSLTFKSIDSSTSSIGSFFGFAMFVSLIGLLIIIRLGKYLERRENILFDELQTNDYLFLRQRLIEYSQRRRTCKLLARALALTMGWAWSQAIRELIKGLYSANVSVASSLWLYALIVTLLATYINCINARYLCLIPQHPSIALQPQSVERVLLSFTWGKAIEAIVGLAWFDAFNYSFSKFGNDIGESAAFWLMAIALIASNIILKYLWEHYWLNRSISTSGVANTLRNAFPGWVSGEEEVKVVPLVKDEGISLSANRIDSFWYTFYKSFVELCIEALVVAGGNSIGAAVKSTLTSITNVEYEPNSEKDANASLVLGLWLAVFLTLIICGFVIGYMSKLSQKMKSKRILALKQLEKDYKNDGLITVTNVATKVSNSSSNNSNNQIELQSKDSSKSKSKSQSNSNSNSRSNSKSSEEERTEDPNIE